MIGLSDPCIKPWQFSQHVNGIYCPKCMKNSTRIIHCAKGLGSSSILLPLARSLQPVSTCHSWSAIQDLVIPLQRPDVCPCICHHWTKFLHPMQDCEILKPYKKRLERETSEEKNSWGRSESLPCTLAWSKTTVAGFNIRALLVSLKSAWDCLCITLHYFSKQDSMSLATPLSCRRDWFEKCDPRPGIITENLNSQFEKRVGDYSPQISCIPRTLLAAEYQCSTDCLHFVGEDFSHVYCVIPFFYCFETRTEYNLWPKNAGWKLDNILTTEAYHDTGKLGFWCFRPNTSRAAVKYIQESKGT